MLIGVAMKNKLLVIGICLVLLIGACVGTLATQEKSYTRVIQHEISVSLNDLSEQDQKAASSLALDVDSFASHLPVVRIDTAGQTIPGAVLHQGIEDKSFTAQMDISGAEIEEENDYTTYTVAEDGRNTVQSSFTLYNNPEGINRLTDSPDVESWAEVRYRGHSSRSFDKKSYALTLTKQDRVTDNPKNILDMGSEESWILYGPFLDKTLLRNYLSLNLAGQFMEYVPDVRFCELFVNDEYQGLYLLMESVKYGQDRVAMTPSDPRTPQTSYLVRRDWKDVNAPYQFDDFLEMTNQTQDTPVEVLYPSDLIITPQQWEWIQSDFNSIEKALYSYDYDTSLYGYWTTLDSDTFIAYAIMNEFSGNSDAGSYSTYFYKDARGKLCIGPVWDFNNAYNNYFEIDMSSVGFLMPNSPLYFMLYKDETFVDGVIARYKQLRLGVLSDAYIDSFIDKTIEYLGPAIDRNYEIWGYSFDPALLAPSNKLTPDERNPQDYEQAVHDLKEAISDRGEWLDENIDNLHQYSHESVNKGYNH